MTATPPPPQGASRDTVTLAEHLIYQMDDIRSQIGRIEGLVRDRLGETERSHEKLEERVRRLEQDRRVENRIATCERQLAEMNVRLGAAGVVGAGLTAVVQYFLVR